MKKILIAVTFYELISIIGNYLFPTLSSFPLILKSPAFYVLTFVVLLLFISLVGLWERQIWAFYLYFFIALLETFKIQFPGFHYNIAIGLIQFYITLFGKVTINLIPLLITVVLFSQNSKRRQALKKGHKLDGAQ